MKKGLLILTFILVSIVSFAQRQRTTSVFDSDTTTRPKAGFYGIGVRSGRVFLVKPTGTTERILAANTHVGVNGQFLFSNGTVNLWRTPVKGDVGLGNVDNTSDLNKPISTATQTALNAKFTLPSLTSGSILFSNGTTISQNNSQLFWDNTNSRLGIGTALPISRLSLGAEITSGGTSNMLRFFDDGSGRLNESNNSYGIGFNWATGRYALTAGTNGFFSFFTQNNEVFRIASSGNIGIGTTSPDVSARLHVSSTTQGVLITRGTTTQINAIASPANGLMVYNTTLNKLCVYENGTWKQVTTTNM